MKAILILIVLLTVDIFSQDNPESGDMRFQNDRYEIFIDEVLENYWESDSSLPNNVLRLHEEKIKGWFDIDSLYKANGRYFDFYMGYIDLEQFLTQRKYFNVLIQRYKNE